MISIEELRKDIVAGINNLRLKKIWKVGEFVTFANPEEDEETILNELELEKEEDYNDEASKWLEQQEEIKKQKQNENLKLKKLKDSAKGVKEFKSQKFGTITFTIPESGKWPGDPGESPSWFPLKSKDLSSKENFRSAFKKEEIWQTLQQAASHPEFLQTLQTWLLPKVILLLGKPWWDNNKALPTLKGVPFGLFDDETRRKNRASLDNLPQGKSFIYIIQLNIARALGQYLSTKGPGNSMNLPGYINTVLNRSMISVAGKVNDRISVRVPVCGYCRVTRKLKTPPALEYDSSTGLYKCPNCAQELKMEEENLQSSIEEVEETNIDITYLKNQIKTLESKGKKDSVIYKAYERRLNLSIQNMNKNNLEIEDRKREMEIRKTMSIGVPRIHVMCINENCPGQKVPLSFVDWSNPFWNSEEGKTARDYLGKKYHVVEPTNEQSANDDGVEIDEWSFFGKASGYRPPPKVLLNVPFICPFDGMRFTPLEAKNKGPISISSNHHMGGLFVSPPKKERLVYAPSINKDISTKDDEKGEELSFEDLYDSSGQKIEMSSDRAEEFASAKIELDKKFNEVFDLLLQKRKKLKTMVRDETGNLRMSSRKNMRLNILNEFLYDAVIEWAASNKIDFMAWIYERSAITKNIYSSNGEYVTDIVNYYVLDRKRATQIKSSILSSWFKKIIDKYPTDKLENEEKKQQYGSWKDGFDLLTWKSSWITNKDTDKIPSVVYFISTVENYSKDFSIVKNHIGYGKNKPLGNSSPRNTKTSKTYGKNPRIAIVYGAWDFNGKNINKQMMETPIPESVGDKIASHLRSISSSVAYSDFKSVYLRNDDMLGLNNGDFVLVKVSFLLDQGGLYPIKMIDNVYKDLKKTIDEIGE